MGNDTAIASVQKKIDDLNQKAWEARVNDSLKAFQLSQESVNLARSINYSKGLAEGLRSLGFGYVRLFKNDEAAPLLREALSLFQSLNDVRGQAVVYEYLGIIERNWGNLGSSLELLLKGYALIQQVDSLEIEVTSCYQIGVTYKHLGNHENALDYLYRALSIAKKSNNALMEAYAINIIGSIYFDNGDYNDALDCYQRSLIIRQESHDKWGEAGSLDNIGFTYLKLNDFDKAIDYCNQSLQITQSTGDKKGEANTLLHLAEIFQQAGDIRQASKFSNESLEIRKARSDKRGEAEVLLFLADLYKNRSDAEDQQIYEWLSDALKIADEIKAQDILSKAYYNLHEYYRKKGNHKESLIQLEAHLLIEKELHKNTINQKVANLEISHKAEAISERNKELTELNERIEKANAELKIEASLERVRAVAMGMKEPADMINVCRMISDQLQQLGFKEIRNVQTVIIYLQKHEYLNYQYFTPYDKESIEIIDYRLHPDVLEFTNQMLSSPDAYYTKTFEGEELKIWREYRKQTNQLPDPRLDATTSSHYYFYSIGSGALGVTTYAPLKDEQIDLFKRFRNVFELAYRRFIDIEKAMAQAREAQIETGLERVRSKTMAMHKSEEVTSVAVSLNEELLKLGFEGGSTIIIMDKETGGTEQWTGFSQDKSLKSCYVPYFKHPCHDAQLNAWKKGEEFLVYTLAGDEKRSLDEHYFTTGYKIFPESDKKWMREMASVTFSHAFMKYGAIHWGPDHLTEEQLRILQRFSKVFEQSYTRFLDLQKAEAQAREAQIELALERVRAKAMAMQGPAEFVDVINVIGEQFIHLDFDIEWVNFGANGLDIADGIDIWNFAVIPGGESVSSRLFIPRFDHPIFIDAPKQLDEYRKTGNDFFVIAYDKKYKDHWLDHLFAETIFKDLPVEYKAIQYAKTGYTSSNLALKNTFLSIGKFDTRSFTDEQHAILRRFGKAFGQAYTRFLDLQKAESQAREAQIEAALERVRAKVMAMTSSKDLNETSLVFGEQLRKLDIDWQFSYFWLIEESKNENTFWITWPDYKTSFTTYTIAEAEQYFNECLVSWRAGVKIHDNYVPPEGVQAWLDTFQRIADDAGGEAKKVMVPQTFPNGVFYYDAMMKYGSFGICINKPATDEEKKIQCRFAIEFERAYTRFLDLKQAEAQAREAQIELGLERVRARAMAMQKSDELKELIGTVSTELSKLDIILDRCFIMTYDIKTLGVTWWMANPEASSDPIGLYVKYHEQAPYLAFLKAWQDRLVKWQFILEGSVKKTWDEFLFVETELSKLPDFVIDNMRANERVYLSASFNNFGCLTLATLEPLSDEQFDIMLRFAKVFDLTYTRFNDLKQAEAQAREAQIELGLEKVRAKAMAMHKSDDLKMAVATVFEELDKLNLGLIRCGIAILDKERPRSDIWITIKSDSGNTIQVSGDEPLDIHPLLKGAYDAWLKQEDFSYILQNDDLLNYYQAITKTNFQQAVSATFKTEKKDQQQYYFNAVFQDGSIFAFLDTPFTDEAKTVMKRFANVFNLTYKRFLDLQKAEAQTREAKIEAALERVRARALAMQEPEELKDVAQVLRTEMGLLGVEELETCSIYINDENAEKAECWYALKDIGSEKKKLVNDHFALNLKDTWVGREMLQFYRSAEKQISIVMQGENRKEWIRYCEEKSAPLRGYYGEVIPDRTYHLYKFSHGAIGAASAGDISEESWRMLRRAASVFSLAYSRFKDLTQARIDLIKLKEEKKRAEDALTELQATQKQLIQSEKMASLGELTAGIAHEIQNPLNFVNNFSDVSNELLEEMKTELEKGNAEEARAIAIDVKENLEKILHHGKRADAIVKGMLQHSRSSSGQKELTDINTLAEEYLRLAYHGLRAKDKFFHAKFQTDLDPSINKINIVPQEIGRVILNLINNSFYAVSEKKLNVSNGYEPCVTVSTKKVNDKVEIRVIDNGNGIPQKVLDKIFQPFFTTKPTGQGTGLGLSMSYDIITKGHDGEIKVETKEGEGSEFIISLPMK